MHVTCVAIVQVILQQVEEAFAARADFWMAETFRCMFAEVGDSVTDLTVIFVEAYSILHAVMEALIEWNED